MLFRSNYAAAEKTFNVTVVDKMQATVTISGMPGTLTYGDIITLTPTAKDGETALPGGKWDWNYDNTYFKQVESYENTIKLQAINTYSGTDAITVATASYTGDTHAGSGTVTVSSIAKKTLTKDDLNGIPASLTKVYDGA